MKRLIVLLLCLLTLPSVAISAPTAIYPDPKILEDMKEIGFDVTVDPDRPCRPGLIKWNPDDGTLDVCTNIEGHTIQVGQEMAPRVVNKSGSTISNGEVVNISGAQGNRIAVSLANAISMATSRVIGIATSDIENNAEGPVALIGKARDIDTRNFTAGDSLYLSDTTDGAIVNTPPDAPSRKTFIGIAENSTVNGSIWVTIANGRPIWGQNDVYNQVANSVANDLLVHDGTAWTNTADIIVNSITYSDTYWNDQQVDLGGVQVGVSAPTWTNYKGGQVLAFSGGPADTNKINFNAQLSHEYKEGTDIDLHAHWTLEDGTSCNAVFSFTHSWANINDTWPAETTVGGTVASSGVVDKQILSDIATIDGTGKTISSVLIMSLTRDSTDVLDTCDNLDVYMVQLDIHYEIDAPGSEDELIK